MNTHAVAISGNRFNALTLQADGTVLGFDADHGTTNSLPMTLSNVVAVAVGGYSFESLNETIL